MYDWFKTEINGYIEVSKFNNVEKSPLLFRNMDLDKSPT